MCVFLERRALDIVYPRVTSISWLAAWRVAVVEAQSVASIWHPISESGQSIDANRKKGPIDAMSTKTFKKL
jgi:hypothetical protein